MNKPPTLKTDLAAVLEDFRIRCNCSDPVKRLIRRWDRIIEIQVSGSTSASYFLRSHSGKVTAPKVQSGPPDMTIAGSAETLRDIFCGLLNPARAHLDGELQVFGSQKDQLVLDSVVLLIWGL